MQGGLIVVKIKIYETQMFAFVECHHGQYNHHVTNSDSPWSIHNLSVAHTGDKLLFTAYINTYGSQCLDTE